MNSLHAAPQTLPTDSATKQRVRRGFLVGLSALVAGVGLFATQLTAQADDDDGWGDDDGWYGGYYGDDDGWYGGYYVGHYGDDDGYYNPYYYGDDDWDDDWDD